MKRHLLWTFDRGSFQWDILCVLILAFLFVPPRNAFQDVPDFMKMPETGAVRITRKDGNTIFTSKLSAPRLIDSNETRKVAKETLERSLGISIDPESRTQPIRDWTGRVIGYAIWNKEKS
jgi:hypothetical protein